MFVAKTNINHDDELNTIIRDAITNARADLASMGTAANYKHVDTTEMLARMEMEAQAGL